MFGSLEGLNNIPEHWFQLVILICLIFGLGIVIISFLRSWIYGKRFKTNILDDYYPLPRKITIRNEPTDEIGFHVKLNYQILIERITRKLYFLFLLIVSFATTFIYVLYSTSLSETIAPTENVLVEYKEMIDSIISVEEEMNELQISHIKELTDLPFIKDNLAKNTFSDASGVQIEEMLTSLITEHVKFEDQLIVDVSTEFFDIYYVRYVIVRLFVATVMFTLLTYFISLYNRMREDRNDFIRKEEALSTYLSVVDQIDGHQTEKRYQLLRDKIPNFPLNQLFEKNNPKGRKHKNYDNLYLESLNTMQKLIETQLTAMKGIASKIELGKK